MGRLAGTNTFVMLQPVPWFGDYSDPVHAAFPFGDIDAARETYRRLIEASQNEYAGLLFDLSSALYDFEKPYLDSAHYTDAANRLLAREIARLILRRMKES